MTPHRLADALARSLGAPVRLRPVADEVPLVWSTRALAAHAARDPAAVERTRRLATATRGVEVEEDEARLRLDATDVAEVLAWRAAADEAASVRDLHHRQRERADTLRLTRDATSTSYERLVRHAGEASAWWALARSADGVRVDVPLAALGTRTLADPLLTVQLACSRLRRATGPAAGAALLVGLVGEAPMVLQETVRTGRTRPWALHLEAVAEQALAWTGSRPDTSDPGPGLPPVTWTAAQAAGAARIVLASGLETAGVPAPAQI